MSDESKSTQLSEDDLQDLVASSDTGARQPSNALTARILVFVALAWSLFQLWYASPLPFMLGVFIVNDAEARAIHLGFAVFLGFMAFPALSKDPDGKVPFVAIALAILPALMFVLVVLSGDIPTGEMLFPLALVIGAGVLIVFGALQTSRTRIPLVDWALALLGTYCATYGFLNYDALADRPGLPTELDIVVSATGLVILLEATRRALGPPLMMVALFFLCYVFFGDAAWVPDVVKYQGASLNRAMSHMWLGPEGTFGIAIGVSAKFVFLFVLFGALLEKAGAGIYFIKVAFSLLGHLRGGPAKAAVVASGMTGLISGSSIANVVTTGVFTMPLMKRVGFSSEKAGAVEVASSVNGQIMPPVMGAAAFLMVEYVGIPYIDVVKHAFLPAIISYIALVYIVHLEAVKTGMEGLPKPGEPLAPKWAFISFGVTVASIMIIAGALYWIFQIAALLDQSHWVVVGVLAIFALQFILFGSIRRSLPKKQVAHVISVGGIVLCNTVIGAIGLFHAMQLIKLAAGSALGFVVAILLAAVAVGLMWYGSRYPELELDDPNSPIISLPEVGPTVKSGLHFLLPILVLVWCLMVERLSPALSAFWATVLMIAILLTQRQLFAVFRGNGQSMGDASRQGGGELFDGLVSGARNMIGIGIATATAGIVVGTVTLTGIGLVMSAFVEFLSGGNLIIMLLLVAVLSLILGMGLPTTANYIVVSSLMAPVIVDVGAGAGLVVPLIAVHLFVFYFGIMADVTPPVGLASFAAAAVSGGDPMRTGFTAFYYSLRTAALPFLFIFNTDLILFGVDNLLDASIVFVTATIAMLIFAAATQGFFIARSRYWESAVLLLIAFTIFRPGFWMDMVFPPTDARPGSEIYEQAEARAAGEGLRVVLEGEDFDTLQIVTQTVLLPIGAVGTGEERLAEAGITLRQEPDGRQLVDLVDFGSPAESLGVQWDFEVKSVLVDNDVPPSRLMWIPAFLLLGVIILIQRRRRETSDRPALAA